MYQNKVLMNYIL